MMLQARLPPLSRAPARSRPDACPSQDRLAYSARSPLRGRLRRCHLPSPARNRRRSTAAAAVVAYIRVHGLRLGVRPSVIRWCCHYLSPCSVCRRRYHLPPPRRTTRYLWNRVPVGLPARRRISAGGSARTAVTRVRAATSQRNRGMALAE